MNPVTPSGDLVRAAQTGDHTACFLSRARGGLVALRRETFEAVILRPTGPGRSWASFDRARPRAWPASRARGSSQTPRGSLVVAQLWDRAGGGCAARSGRSHGSDSSWWRPEGRGDCGFS